MVSKLIFSWWWRQTMVYDTINFFLAAVIWHQLYWSELLQFDKSLDTTKSKKLSNHYYLERKQANFIYRKNVLTWHKKTETKKNRGDRGTNLNLFMLVYIRAKFGEISTSLKDFRKGIKLTPNLHILKEADTCKVKFGLWVFPHCTPVNSI